MFKLQFEFEPKKVLNKDYHRSRGRVLNLIEEGLRVSASLYIDARKMGETQVLLAFGSSTD